MNDNNSPISEKYAFDPELREIVAMLPPTNMEDYVAARDNLKEMIAMLGGDSDTSGIRISDQTIPGLDDDVEIPVRLYQPDNAASNGAILYIHGGGFVVGDLDSEHASVLSIVRHLQVTVLSVDYRLAPEHPFPAGLNDCYAALYWFAGNAAELGINPERIAVFGQSAGGGLSAALALMAKDREGPKPCFQFLGMPELDDRLDTVSMREFDDTPMWNRPNAIISWDFYLGKQYQRGADDVPVLAAPARASREQLEGLPPAYVTAMEFDPLRDEDVCYALSLMEAGVAVELHTFPGTFHGSSLVPQAQVSKRQQQELLSVLARALDIAQD